jgi:hypothetical protein
LPEARQKLVEAALQCCQEDLAAQRRDLLASARCHLGKTVGDSRWPWNEISLWNYAASIAALFKATTAQAVLDGHLPIPAQVKWRLLHISFDGLGFIGGAHHVSDLLGRHRALEQALDAAQAVLETKFPVGNEIYRDENGSVYIVADRPDVLRLADAEGTTLEQHVRDAFDQAEIAGELRPEIQLSKKPCPGSELPLGQVLDPSSQSDEARVLLQQPEVETAQGWWPAPGESSPEICTVCGLRPVAHGTPDRARHDDLAHDAAREPTVGCQTCKTLRRKLCYTCFLRRGRRSQDWARNTEKAFERTIWVNEVADANGRAALVVGQFDLRGWLDGKLIATLRKNDSFARIHRCWETTQQFWRQVQEDTIPEKVGTIDWRLGIKVSNPDTMSKALGDYHVYQWPLGRGIALSVVWDAERRCFIAADNLAYLAGPGQLDRLKAPAPDQLHSLYIDGELIGGQKAVTLEEPSGYGRPSSTTAQALDPEPYKLEGASYVPTIPILAEPATFMALVPASAAMDVLEAIHEKYAAEMARVRDRLPLHLGLVVFPRPTPLRAVLDAGQALLDVAKRDRWETWTVETLDPKQWDPANRPGHGRRSVAFDNGITWQIPLLMGDNQTPDQWYAHCIKADTARPDKISGEITPDHLVHVSQLRAGDSIWVRPSTFDYVFLDTTGRRFEVAHDACGRRLGFPGRPFDLDRIRGFVEVWGILAGQGRCSLENSQLHALLGLARAKGQDWRPDNRAAVNRLMRDALLRAAWPGGWVNVPVKDRNKLLAATESGWLPEVLDFYLSILRQRTLSQSSLTGEVD